MSDKIHCDKLSSHVCPCGHQGLGVQRVWALGAVLPCVPSSHALRYYGATYAELVPYSPSSTASAPIQAPPIGRSPLADWVG